MSAPATLVQTAQRTPTNVLLVPIDPALAKRVRAVAQAAERKRQERDQLILEAHEAGASLREIGELVGLSHVGVMKIVNRGTSNVPPELLDSADPNRRIREARLKAQREQGEQP